jgi:hypothetical protein
MNNTIFFHVTNQELIPVDSKYENITNIDNYADESIEKVIIQDMCDFLKQSDVPIAMQKIFQKISPNGSLTMQGVDIKQLSNAVCFSHVSIEDCQDIIFNSKQSMHTMSQMIEYLKEIGFIIGTKKYINLVQYYILAIKE